jgi:uncharacterized membrane protein
MKRLLMAVLLAAVAPLGLIGCNSGSPGGPGASNRDNNKPHITTQENTFSLSVPGPTATHIKQGEQKVVDIGIDRGKNFSQDVGLKIEGLPDGVTAEPAHPDLKAGQEKVRVTLKASDKAALGDFTVKVVGHPASGPDATNDFKLTVEKK